MAKRNDVNLDAIVGTGENIPPEDVARSFAGSTSPISSSMRVDRDRDEDEDSREIERLERELSAATPLAASPDIEVPTDMAGIMRALTIALGQIAAGSANSQAVAAKALESASRQVQPDNKQGPLISTLNPQGELSYPKPRLKCEMHIPWEVENESVTWEEAELLNLLQQGTFPIRKNDGSKVRIEVKIFENLAGRPEKLFMNAEMGFSQENFWQMPSLVSILRQVLAQDPKTAAAAKKVLTMDDRFAMVAQGELAVSEGQR